MAGKRRSFARWTSFSSWAAPSRRLYSEWTWRWTNSACCTTGSLLELDGGGGLVRDVVERGGDPGELAERPRQLRHHGRRPAARIRRPPSPRGDPPRAALDADGAEGDDRALHARRQRKRGRLDGGMRLGGQTPPGEPRTGDRVAPHDVVRQPQLLAEHPHLVLVKVDEGLDHAARLD